MTIDWLSPAQLNLVAAGLFVVVIAREASRPLAGNLWYFGAYTLLGAAVVVGILVAIDRAFRVEVFFFGVAVVTGVYWTSITRPAAPLSWRGHAASMGAAAGIDAVLAVVAVTYHWWVAPGAVLAVLGAGLLWQAVTGPQRRRRASMGAGLPSGLPPRDDRSVPLVCQSCGLRASIASASHARRFVCPRCKAAVLVPGTPA